jgi:phosphoserine aminotransferase
MSTKRVYNFNPGPAALPLEVLEKFKKEFMNFGGKSIFEISHRSKEFASILDETRHLLRELMNIPSNYQVLFLQGGATLQFAMVPLNLMDKTADYIVTGEWSKRALADAEIVGEPNVIFTSADSNFNRVPHLGEIRINPSASYVHITSNNTIFGTQYHNFPHMGDTPLVADMSSDILSRPLDISHFGLLYAGAQKNAGPAGVTIVIIREDLANQSFRRLPAYLKYHSHLEKGSLYNTPPVGGIYIMQLVLHWLKENGGLPHMDKVNRQKAELLYESIDTLDFYQGTAEKECRSLMNVTFTLPSAELTEKFINQAQEKNIFGIKGHRSVGGIRASIYNAVSLEAVETLVSFMEKFRRKQ